MRTPVVHEPGRGQLAHAGIHDRVARAALAPRLEPRVAALPAEPVELGAERAVLDVREVPQDVGKEIAPAQLADERVRVAAQPVVPLRCGEHAVRDAADADRAELQVGGQLRCGGHGRQVALGRVTREPRAGLLARAAEESLQASMRMRLARGPWLARGLGEAQPLQRCEPRRRQLVTGEPLHARERLGERQRIARVPERCVDRVRTPAPVQHQPRRHEQPVVEALRLHTRCAERAFHAVVPRAQLRLVLVVPVDGVRVCGARRARQHVGRVAVRERQPRAACAIDADSSVSAPSTKRMRVGAMSARANHAGSLA
jgi:hypothetical protein